MNVRDVTKTVRIYLDNRPISDVITTPDKQAKNSAQNRLRNSAKLHSQTNSEPIHPKCHNNAKSSEKNVEIDISKINLNVLPPTPSKDFQAKRDAANYKLSPPTLGNKYQSSPNENVNGDETKTFQGNHRNDLGAESLYKVPPPSTNGVPLKAVRGDEKTNLRRPKQTSPEQADSQQSPIVSNVKSSTKPNSEDSHLSSKEEKKCDTVVDKLKESNTACKATLLLQDNLDKSASHRQSLPNKNKDPLEQEPTSESKSGFKSDPKVG